MSKLLENCSLFIINSFIILTVILFAFFGNKAIPTVAEQQQRHTIIIDAGHGGIDGGALSCTGALESHINLAFAKRLNDLMHLFGYNTIMIRDTDISVYTEGDTIAAKKVSDIKERVRIANTTAHALYLSIHQNHYPDPKYWGSQIFYNAKEGSSDLAALLQQSIKENISTDNHRKVKKSSGVYLMDHINCKGILIECGFLSNLKEEALLRNSEYQKKLCCVIATTTAQYLNT